jgi:hypothetical protein
LGDQSQGKGGKDGSGAVKVVRGETLLRHEHIPELSGKKRPGQDRVDPIMRFHFRLGKIGRFLEKKVELVRCGRFARYSHGKSCQVIITNENEEARLS